MLKWIVRRIATYLGTHYPDRLTRILGATESNIAAILENLSNRSDAFVIASKLRRHAGDERFHAALLFDHAKEPELLQLAAKRLDQRNNWIGDRVVIRGGRKRIKVFRFLFLGQDPLCFSWPNLFALIRLLETYSFEFYDALSALPGWEFTARIASDEHKHASLWDAHPERLFYWNCRIGLALALTLITGGLNLSKQTLE